MTSTGLAERGLAQDLPRRSEMSAIGFGQNVTGGGKNPDRIEVTKGKNSGSGTLADAIDKANKANGREMEIVIKANIDPNKDRLIVKAKNLTIRAEGGAVINQNLLYFDCTKADNVWLTDLRFDSNAEERILERSLFLRGVLRPEHYLEHRRQEGRAAPPDDRLVLPVP
jgi:hypothetical protein